MWTYAGILNDACQLHLITVLVHGPPLLPLATPTSLLIISSSLCSPGIRSETSYLNKAKVVPDNSHYATSLSSARGRESHSRRSASNMEREETPAAKGSPRRNRRPRKRNRTNTSVKPVQHPRPRARKARMHDLLRSRNRHANGTFRRSRSFFGKRINRLGLDNPRLFTWTIRSILYQCAEQTCRSPCLLPSVACRLPTTTPHSWSILGSGTPDFYRWPVAEGSK